MIFRLLLPSVRPINYFSNMGNLKTTFIELPATINGHLDSVPSKDVYSLVKLPSRAIDLLTAILKGNGFEDTLPINPAFGRRGARFTPVDWRRIVSSDVIGISAITRTARQSYELADRIRAENPKTRIIFGGPHTGALPYDALPHGDIVVMNEGDRTIMELMQRLQEDIGSRDLKDIKGIAYNDINLNPVVNEKRPFLTSEELNTLPFPVYTQDALKHVTHTVINTSRGCPFGCEYCAVIENFGRKFRYLDIERTIELIEFTLKQTRKPIFFGDDSFSANPFRVKKLLERILEKGIKMPRWLAQVRVESANDTELLKLMKRANCERVCIGFESISNEALKAFKKEATVEKNSYAIKRYHDFGISIHGMFILGTDFDTPKSIAETVEYGKAKRIDTVQFISLVPLPGTPLTKKLHAAGKVISTEWNLYDGHHVLVKPALMEATELQEEIEKAWLSFYSFREAIKHLFLGNEHLFNFIVRLFGRKIIRKASTDSTTYKQTLAKIISWQKQIKDEYSEWSAKADRVIADAKAGLGHRHQNVIASLEDAYERLQKQKLYINDTFSPYIQKFHQEVIQKMQQKMQELSEVWNHANRLPSKA